MATIRTKGSIVYTIVVDTRLYSFPSRRGHRQRIIQIFLYTLHAVVLRKYKHLNVPINLVVGITGKYRYGTFPESIERKNCVADYIDGRVCVCVCEFAADEEHSLSCV